MAERIPAGLLQHRSARAPAPWIRGLPVADTGSAWHADHRLGPARGILLGATISLALWLAIGLLVARLLPS